MNYKLYILGFWYYLVSDKVDDKIQSENGCGVYQSKFGLAGQSGTSSI